MGTDLLEIANIQKIWESCVARHQSDSEKSTKEREEREQKTVAVKLAELEEQVKSIVTEYIGKAGRGIVDKEIDGLGGNACLVDAAGSTKIMGAIERSAKLLISGTNSKLMMEKLNALITKAKSEF
jgi:hypothetical protein